MTRQLRVLVVDDREPDIEHVRRLLDQIDDWNPTIHSTHDLKDANEILDNQPVDVLVLDHRFPSQTGLEWLSNRNAKHDFPVVILSGLLPSDEAMKLYEESSYTYLEKGNLSPNQLRIGISNAIQRHELEEELRRSLMLKDKLLKEVHHRVKNNMQVISSLLGLQANQTDHTESHEQLKDCQRRIQSMAMVHRTLYESEDLSSFDFGQYIEQLVQVIFRSFGDLSQKTEVNFDLEQGVSLDLDTAIPCGLILNELVSNALRHGLQEEGNSNRIDVQFHRIHASRYAMSVADKGPGLPTDFDPRETDSLGLKLVVSLAEDQLKGDCTIQSGDGTRVRIEFEES